MEELKWTAERHRLSAAAWAKGWLIQLHSPGRYWIAEKSNPYVPITVLGVGLTEDQVELFVNGTEEDRADLRRR
ncbi:MAG TPA: hypothetical protein VES79_08290 [Solirubrobacteraceae bacterium]|nr:hypothetical protein [Solirubrobacteraceae bacterium]